MDGLVSFTANDLPPGDKVPPEEVRFGVILNGGVSLAVWMGGAVHELDRLTKALEDGGEKVYATLLRFAGCTARADVIAGTSAGGINGAALALAQVNRQADLGMLRNLWIEQGRIESLLRQPFQGNPSSLLQGDEFFLPKLNDAMVRLASARGWRDKNESPIDLTITTTVLKGNQTVTVDSMGQRLPQNVYAGRFHWRRIGGRESATGDPFSKPDIERTAHRLALASRSTASFPVAFEPSFIPVGSPDFIEPSAGSGRTASQRLRPDMSTVVASWGDEYPARDRSRFVIDGGALANTPTLAALKAVEAMPASGPVRRVMLLVYPHAPAPGADPPDRFAESPTVAGALSGLLGALTGQGSRTYVDELEEHNRLAAGRRGTRGDILKMLTAPPNGDPPPTPDPGAGPAALFKLSDAIFVHYRRLRQWRAARDLATRLTGKDVEGGSSTRLPEGWNYERVRQQAERAQLNWEKEHQPRIPYVPDRLPTAAEPDGWGWGVSAAIGVTDVVADLLRRLVWVMPDADPEYDKVVEARRTIFGRRAELEEVRDLLDAAWLGDKVISSLEPNETYWSLRLALYDHLMIGSVAWAEVADWIDRVADNEGRATVRRLRSDDPRAGDARRADVKETLTARLGENAVEHARLDPQAVPADKSTGHAGDRVRALVTKVLNELQKALPALDRWGGPNSPHDDLKAWHDGLGLSGSIDLEQLLPRLLQLEVASTALGDEVTTGATLPVELVQLSAQTQNGFAEHSRTGDDKLGGWSVNRFGGFLKRSWRANDWTWGRADAATVLCRTVLQPQRVRRAARLSGFLETGTTTELAERTLEELVAELGLDREEGRIARRLELAHAELEIVFGASDGDLPAAMPALADLFAGALHEKIVVNELPALAAAIRADRVEGAHTRSRGEVFLAEQAPLMQRIETAAVNNSEVAEGDRRKALRVFDQAGIGREPLRDESTSDMSIRTATTAAAVMTTVADSQKSGLKATKPVTRTLRGAMLLPYWVITGLSSKGVLARSLALLGLAVGGALLALSLFGVLSENLSGPATAVGASAVLTAFAYGALRSGTLLHSVVLLSPVIPLMGYAVLNDDARSSAKGGATLLGILALIVALIILGSLSAVHGSVWATLDRLADRRLIPSTPESGPDGQRTRLLGIRRAWRRLLGILLTLVPVVTLIAVLMGIGYLVAYARQEDWLGQALDLPDRTLLIVMVAAVAWGAVAAHIGGRSLQVLRRGVGAHGAPRFEPLSNPRGAAAGWSVVYGIAYLLVTAVLVWQGWGLEDTPWYSLALLTSATFAALLLVVIPVGLPFMELSSVRSRERVRARTRPQRSEASKEERWARYADSLIERDLGYRAFVQRKSRALTLRGKLLEWQVRRVGDDAREKSGLQAS